MTGWRVGWIAASIELGEVFENLIQIQRLVSPHLCNGLVKLH